MAAPAWPPDVPPNPPFHCAKDTMENEANQANHVVLLTAILLAFSLALFERRYK
jgi:hypothetical protein